MKNYVQDGDTITVVAPYALNSGDGCLVGSIFGVATSAAANGAAVEIKPEGVFDIAALSTDVAAQGAKLYWDNTNKRLTVTSAGNTLIGAATVAKIATETTVRAYVDGVIR